jgi:hypothetical protein
MQIKALPLSRLRKQTTQENMNVELKFLELQTKFSQKPSSFAWMQIEIHLLPASTRI